MVTRASSRRWGEALGLSSTCAVLSMVAAIRAVICVDAATRVLVRRSGNPPWFPRIFRTVEAVSSSTNDAGSAFELNQYLVFGSAPFPWMTEFFCCTTVVAAIPSTRP